jgi:hypothetical protein
MSVSDILRRSYEFFTAEGHRKVVLPVAATILAFAIAAWRSIRRRRILIQLRSIAFQPHGLREPVHNIARKHGTADDLRKINALLSGTSDEIISMWLEFQRRRDSLRNQLGDVGLNKLDNQVEFAKHDIREDLAALSRRSDPSSRAAHKSAEEIEVKMVGFNDTVSKITKDHYASFWADVASLRKKIKLG